LSFDDATVIDQAKVGVLAASIVAGLLGYGLLRTGPARSDDVDQATSALTAASLERAPSGVHGLRGGER
jgi:hypothetical protein